MDDCGAYYIYPNTHIVNNLWIKCHLKTTVTSLSIKRGYTRDILRLCEQIWGVYLLFYI